MLEPPEPRGQPRGDAGVVAFDDDDPPRRDLLDACVHCGFCLPACPTYSVFGEEMDSPRGRILLIDQASRGQLGLSATVVRHLDACLGCVACETACPSGVQYGALIETARAQIERRFKRPWSQRVLRDAIFSLAPYHRRLRPAALLLAATPRVLRPRWGRLALAPDLSLDTVTQAPPPLTPAQGTTRLRVALVLGCVQRAFFGDVNAASARVLSAFGCDVLAPPDQGCCGALELHAGRHDAARERQSALLDRLDQLGCDRIVVTTAGCGSALRASQHPAASRVVDALQLLVELEPPTLHRLPLRVAYHDACHHLHGQGIHDQPRALLGLVPGLELVELADPGTCCGSAGIYNLVEPDAAQELGRRRAAVVRDAGPDVLVAANAGCLVQIGAYLDPPLPGFHPLQVLDHALV